jgi:DNA-binding CsgD family transcriptional regulator
MGRALPTKPRPAEADSEGLVRRLIRISADDRPAAPQRKAAIVFDVRIDGYRCVLIQEAEAAPADRSALSPREQEIARMVAKGFPNKMIARVLDISTWTVGTYLRRIFAKLGVSSRAAMVAVLMEAGPIDRAAVGTS